MKLTVSQKDISSNLAIAARAIPARPTHPILGNFLAIADQESQTLTLTSFDLSLGIRTSFPAQVKESGAIAIPLKFLEVINKLPDGEIDLTLQELGESLTLKIKTKSEKYEVRGLSPEEFPELPEIEGDAIEVSAIALADGISKSLFASSTDETKQVLTGVHLTIGQDTVEFAATDGHRLAVMTVGNDGIIESPVSVTIPAKALKEVLSILGKEEALVRIKLSEGQALFEVDNRRVTTRTLEGQYPSYQQLLPKQFSRVVTCDRKHLLSVVERVSVLAEQKNSIVKFEIAETAIEVSSESAEVGRGQATISCQLSGDPIVVAFNSKYLLEGLRNIPGAEINIELNKPLLPVIFSPLNGDKMKYLAMPIQIRD